MPQALSSANDDDDECNFITPKISIITNKLRGQKRTVRTERPPLVDLLSANFRA
jgi:hypothetical protein